jgi:hypothetical protein
MKNRLVRGELLHADRRAERKTDRHYEDNSLFRNFANVSKNEMVL